MVTKENIEAILNEVEEMTLSEWEFISEVVKNAFKNKALEYQNSLMFKDLNVKKTTNHLLSVFRSDDLNK